jgi:hypothetical protein
VSELHEFDTTLTKRGAEKQDLDLYISRWYAHLRRRTVIRTVTESPQVKPLWTMVLTFRDFGPYRSAVWLVHGECLRP